MYARVVTVQVQPGKMDEFLRRLRELVLTPNVRRGFHEGRFLTDAHTGTAMDTTVWETEADANAAPGAGAEGGAPGSPDRACGGRVLRTQCAGVSCVAVRCGSKGHRGGRKRQPQAPERR